LQQADGDAGLAGAGGQGQQGALFLPADGGQGDAFQHGADGGVLKVARPVAGDAVGGEQRSDFGRVRVEAGGGEPAPAQLGRRRESRHRARVAGLAGAGVVLDELMAIGRVHEFDRITTRVFLDLLQSVGGWQFFLLGFDEGEGERLFVFALIHPQQVIHSAAPALERLAVEDVDAHAALLAVDFAVAGALAVVDQFDPLPGVQSRVDQLGAGVGFVVTRDGHGAMIPGEVALLTTLSAC